MKHATVKWVAAIAVVAGIFAFRFSPMQTGSITGTVTPPDGATSAIAISTTDTLKATIADGAFKIVGAKAGTYTLIIDAHEPFADVTKEGITVTDGVATDVGEIPLEQ